MKRKPSDELRSQIKQQKSTHASNRRTFHILNEALYTNQKSESASNPMKPKVEADRKEIEGDELQKMLNGQMLNYNDSIPAEHCKRCKVAILQFHDVDNPTAGVSESERAHKLSEIFVLRQLDSLRD